MSQVGTSGRKRSGDQYRERNLSNTRQGSSIGISARAKSKWIHSVDKCFQMTWWLLPSKDLASSPTAIQLDLRETQTNSDQEASKSKRKIQVIVCQLLTLRRLSKRWRKVWRQLSKILRPKACRNKMRHSSTSTKLHNSVPNLSRWRKSLTQKTVWLTNSSTSSKTRWKSFRKRSKLNAKWLSSLWSLWSKTSLENRTNIKKWLSYRQTKISLISLSPWSACSSDLNAKGGSSTSTTWNA